LQPRNAVLLEGHALIEYLRPKVVVVEQVVRAVHTDDAAYANELQAALLQIGYQVRQLLAPLV
jgi:site-specific DNA-cytosine methylase